MTSCDGTLRGFDERSFPISKQKLEVAIQLLYENNPESIIPDKWQEKDDWVQRGYGFLDTNIFYLEASPEEMYYVSYIGDEEMLNDKTHINIAIRSVFTAKNRNWLNVDKFTDEERERIEKKFDMEIISKLEKYTGVKSIRQD